MRDAHPPTGTGGAPVLYRDRWIECTTEALVIHGYYFPLGLKKIIPYERVRGVREYGMSTLTGKWRIWGSGDLQHWFHLDPGRPHKERALVIDLGNSVKPVITPDGVDQVRAIIESRLAKR